MKEYLEFLKFCLNDEAVMPDVANSINWHELREFAKKQAIAGIFWQGVEKVQGKNKPTDDDVLEWMSTIKRLEKNNKTADEKVAWVTKNFKTEGFRSCLLKGQGNALMYPNPARRTSGDIDIWVEGGDKKVIAYVHSITPHTKACYHHVDFRKAGDIAIEVHYRPSWLNNPYDNKRLQQWFLDHSDACFQPRSNNAIEEKARQMGFNIPTWEFNVVFQLCHIYNHLLHEGIGLRQLIDYFYLLKCREGAAIDMTETLKPLGLATIGGATAWVMKEVLGLPDRYQVCPPDARRGMMLLKEVLAGGNFGHHDDRLLSGSYASPVKANLQRIVRDLRMMRYYPSETLWEPWFRVWHYFWRRRNN